MEAGPRVKALPTCRVGKPDWMAALEDRTQTHPITDQPSPWRFGSAGTEDPAGDQSKQEKRWSKAAGAVLCPPRPQQGGGAAARRRREARGFGRGGAVMPQHQKGALSHTTHVSQVGS